MSDAGHEGRAWHFCLQDMIDFTEKAAAYRGVMQSQRIIAISLTKRATRVDLERFPELPTFSGIIVDFMDRLTQYEGDRSQHVCAPY